MNWLIFRSKTVELCFNNFATITGKKTDYSKLTWKSNFENLKKFSLLSGDFRNQAFISDRTRVCRWSSKGGRGRNEKEWERMREEKKKYKNREIEKTSEKSKTTFGPRDHSSQQQTHPQTISFNNFRLMNWVTTTNRWRPVAAKQMNKVTDLMYWVEQPPSLPCVHLHAHTHCKRTSTIDFCFDSLVRSFVGPESVHSVWTGVGCSQKEIAFHTQREEKKISIFFCLN